MLCRSQCGRATVARGSALEMEIRRGRCRLSVLDDCAQDTEMQRQMERELRLREGACKLLAASSRPEQALGAAKSLLVCNARLLACMAELQRRKEAQLLRRAARRPSDTGAGDERLPCRGTVCISDLRIPLMWKDTEYFRNKGELHRVAVFLLLQLGAEVVDTPLLVADRTRTDLCFDSPLLFSEAGPDFELKVELYSAGLGGDGAPGSAPRKLATRLSTSLGRSAGKRARAAMEGGPGSPPGNGSTGALLLPTPSVPGPKFHLLAHTVLSLAEVQDGFRTHASPSPSACWLPLYGSMCCRLAAQPRCMALPVRSGFLRLQHPGAEAPSGERLFCVLRGTDLLCYREPGDAEAGLEPALTIAVNKETRVRGTEREGRGQPPGMAVTNCLGGEEVTHTLLAESRAEAQRWMEAFWQHFYDMSQWKQCCEELMRIEVPPPRPLPRQGSLYHEMGEWGAGGALCLCSGSARCRRPLLRLTLLFSPLPGPPDPHFSMRPISPCAPFFHVPHFSMRPPSLPHLSLSMRLPSLPLHHLSPHLSLSPSLHLCFLSLPPENAVSAEIRALLSSYYSDR
ncbi:LOW QUALITY PROTEIN: rhotekin [Cuculus canorus]|uniref:LOW QUALITY PROTEIN: rhotekin n=1 Tax=Cuculus canorus TaxID=55661 RepID=UPI0023AA9ADC|nr:LOW QUALITY PROTEIN: rhotekin [Cuculus canorus]